MSSLEIAELTGKRHDHVLRDIRSMLSELYGADRLPSFEETVERPNPSGGASIKSPAFRLPRREVEILVTGYSITLRAKVIDRLRELESEVARPRELSRLELIQMALESEQEKLRLEEDKRALEYRIEEDAPRVAFAKQVEVSEGSISVAQAAKILGTGRQRLFAFLRQAGWVTRKNEPYQSKIEAGYLDVKLGSWEHPDHGVQQSVTALVTGKGLVKLRALWEQRHIWPG
ncbi:MAG: phage regulatory protein/antirepressor Ant [Pseudomonas sp.]|nr:phage regulatory protein/antirepressor Ant [Pseudomonas sp.]